MAEPSDQIEQNVTVDVRRTEFFQWIRTVVAFGVARPLCDN
jgi:hypothetical protein